MLPRGESPRSGGAVEDRARQRGNAVTQQYGRAEINDSGQNPQLAIARLVAPHRVGFISALKRGTFSSNFRNGRRSPSRSAVRSYSSHNADHRDRRSPSREAGARSLRSSSLASLVPAVLTSPAPASRLPLRVPPGTAQHRTSPLPSLVGSPPLRFGPPTPSRAVRGCCRTRSPARHRVLNTHVCACTGDPTPLLLLLPQFVLSRAWRVRKRPDGVSRERCEGDRGVPPKVSIKAAK